MNESSGGTREQILLAAKAEFLEKGFQHASLRNIVKTAGVTTGALYGYYDSKEALFDALVRESYEYAMGRFKEALSTFAALPIERQPESLGQVSGDCMQEMLLYMHEHRDTFHLLLLHSDGTRYATMVDELVALEVDATHRYYTVLAQLGAPMPHVDEALEHMLVTGMFNAYFEIIIHDMPPDKANRYLEEMHDFYTAGWMKIMGQQPTS